MRQKKRDARSNTAPVRQAEAKVNWGHLAAIAVILLIATVAVFQQVRSFEFLRWDDNYNVTDNPYLHPVTDDSAAYFWREPYFASYIPVTRSIWVMAAQMSGATLDPHVFHTLNLLVHTFNVFIVFLILRLLVRRDWPACLGALLFGLHPLQVEPVAWVTGMKDLLGGTFSLLAAWQYLAYARQSKDDPDNKTGRYVHYGAAVVCFILALLSKSSAVSLPFLIFAIDYLVIGRSWLQGVKSLSGWILLAIPIILVTKSSEADSAIKIPGTLMGRPIVAGDALTFYLSKIFVPWPLAADYGRTPDYVAHHAWGYATASAALCLAIVLIMLHKKAPWLLAAFAVVAASILPVMGLVPFDYQVFSTVADRYVYVGMLGPAFAAAWLLTRFEKPIAFGLATAAIIALGELSVIQGGHWRNSDALFAHTLAVNPRSWGAHADVADQIAAAADTLDHSGDKTGAEQKRNAAIAEYETAIRNSPNYHRAHDGLGIVLAKSGKADAAVEQFQIALKCLPVFEEAQVHLSNALYMQGKIDDSIAGFRKALTMNGDDKAARLTLASILRSQKKNDEALTEYHEILRTDPGNAAALQAVGEISGTK